jgi:hypothetical protein
VRTHDGFKINFKINQNLLILFFSISQPSWEYFGSIFSYFISIVIFINYNYEKFKNKVLTKLEVLEFILSILITFFF